MMKVLRALAIAGTTGMTFIAGCSQANLAHIENAAIANSPSLRTSQFNLSNSNAGERLKLSRQGKIRFDRVFSSPHVIPGYVTVIYKNVQRVRVSKNSTNVESIDKETGNQVNRILRANGITKIVDPAGSSVVPEVELDEQQVKASQTLGVEVPHWRSIHYLVFPKEADTNNISSALRSLPAVLTAYPTPEAFPGAAPLYTTNRSRNQFPPTPPSDPGFQPANDLSKQRDDWWWFNRYLVFEGWSLFEANNPGNTPKVAVIDTGFYQGPHPSHIPDPTADIPNYDNSQAASFVNGSAAGTDTCEATTETGSHGTSVASVLASPKNNYKLCGVAPNAVVVPIKIDRNTASIEASILHAANSTNATTINISWHLVAQGNRAVPHTSNPDLAAAIALATGAKNKTVVINSGNTGSLIGDDECDRVGAIVVGGSQRDGYEWPSSCYGKAVDMVAGAHDVTVTGYNPSTNSISSSKEVGTSFATPMVAATAAMMWAVSPPGTSHERIRSELIGGSTFGTTQDPTRLLGADRTPKVGSNFNGIARMRELDVAHSMALAIHGATKRVLRRIVWVA